MKVYIAGPMTGMKDHNFPAFHAAAADLRAQGFEVVSPAEQEWNDDLTREWSFYLKRDIPILLQCDAIALLPGWRESRGAMLESFIAAQLDMETFEYTPPPTLAKPEVLN